MPTYPQCLVDALAGFGQRPTGDLEWDRAVLNSLRTHERNDREPWSTMHALAVRAADEMRKSKAKYADLSDGNTYVAHVNFFLWVANNIVLAPQRRRFVVDDDNRDVLRFLLYYFNECPLAEEVFPGRGYKLHKNILLQGGVGVGKTLMMQVFSEYLKRLNNPLYFPNVSVTQMVNHFSIYNNIDLYTYNEGGSIGFQIKPMHLCLNDVGVDNRPFYGIDTLTVVNDFLHARNELWANLAISDRRFAHITTNLSVNQLKEKFNQKDAYGRIVDRFKTYNIIPLTGASRR